MDPRTVVSKLGRPEVARALGVTRNAVGEAVRAGRFPAAWFVTLRDMGARAGVEVPEALFNWKSAAAESEAA